MPGTTSVETGDRFNGMSERGQDQTGAMDNTTTCVVRTLVNRRKISSY